MAKASSTQPSKLHMSDFFSGAEARLDLWRALAWKARALADGDNDPELEKDLGALLAQLEPLEEFFAYPGTRLMAALKDRLAAGEHEGFSTLAGRIGIAMMGQRRAHARSGALLDRGRPAAAPTVFRGADRAAR
jgi:arginine decarboxylase